MGASSSKPSITTRYVLPNEAGKPNAKIGKDYKEVIKNMNAGVLQFNRCVSMTFSEYQSREHIPEGIFTIQLEMNINENTVSDTDTEQTKTETLQEKIRRLLNPRNIIAKISGSGYLSKISERVEHELEKIGDIPAPIYVMCAKKLDFNGTIIDDTIDEYKGEFKDKKDELQRDLQKIREKANKDIRKEREKREKNIAKKDKEKDKQKERNKMLRNISKKEQKRDEKLQKKQKKFDDKYGDDAFFVDYWEKNSDKAKETLLAEYKWKGMMKVVIYIPNMSVNGSFFTNMLSYKIQNMWMDTIVMQNPLLYNIYNLNEFKFANLKPLFPSPEMYNRFVKNLKDNDGNRRPFSIDQRNHCLNGGCISDTGENLNALIPTYDSKEKTLRRNADRNSPYYPQKCLRPLDFDVNGVGYKDDQKFMRKELPKYMKDKCLKKWMEAHQDFQKSKNFKDIEKHIENADGGDDDDSDPGLEGDLMDHLDNCAREQLRKKRGSKKHYRKWNRYAMIELAERHRRYPGVQEMVFPLFKVVPQKGSKLYNNMYEMPWGDRLLSVDTSLTEGEEIPSAIFSPNRLWSFKVNRLSQVSLYRNGVRVFDLSSTQKRGFMNHTLGLAGGSLVVSAIRSGETKTIEVKNVSMASRQGYNAPLSLVIMDNGMIRLFGDGFVDVLDPQIRDRMTTRLMSLGLFGDGSGGGDGGGDIDEHELMKRVTELDKKEELHRGQDEMEEDLYIYREDIKERMLRLHHLFSNSDNK